MMEALEDVHSYGTGEPLVCALFDRHGEGGGTGGQAEDGLEALHVEEVLVVVVVGFEVVEVFSLALVMFLLWSVFGSLARVFISALHPDNSLKMLQGVMLMSFLAIAAKDGDICPSNDRVDVHV
jgi:hypothetical protein